MSWNKESEFSKTVNDKRQLEFINELYSLLNKYKVTIELEAKSASYDLSYDINFSLDGYRDEEHDEYVGYRDLNLGNYISHEEVKE
jgi:heme-binding NEAT domain protein